MSQLPHLRELTALPASPEYARGARCGTSASRHEYDVINKINKRITAFKPVNPHANFSVVRCGTEVYKMKSYERGGDGFKYYPTVRPFV